MFLSCISLLGVEWKSPLLYGIMGSGGHIPLPGPHSGSCFKRVDICRVSFKKEVRSNFSKVRREMEKFTSRESVES